MKPGLMCTFNTWYKRCLHEDHSKYLGDMEEIGGAVIKLKHLYIDMLHFIYANWFGAWHDCLLDPRSLRPKGFHLWSMLGVALFSECNLVNAIFRLMYWLWQTNGITFAMKINAKLIVLSGIDLRLSRLLYTNKVLGSSPSRAKTLYLIVLFSFKNPMNGL